MVVGFGDWRENWIVNGEWCGWNVWFMMKRMIDDMVKELYEMVEGLEVCDWVVGSNGEYCVMYGVVFKL